MLYPIVESLPRGIHTELGPEGTQLSKGQRQRLLLARALYRKPKYLFMDEPTSSLDPITEAEIVRNLDALLINTTQLIVAHRLDTVRNADKILVLENGEIVEEGTHRELVEWHGYYSRLLHKNDVTNKASK